MKRPRNRFGRNENPRLPTSFAAVRSRQTTALRLHPMVQPGTLQSLGGTSLGCVVQDETGKSGGTVLTEGAGWGSCSNMLQLNATGFVVLASMRKKGMARTATSKSHCVGT